MEKQATGWKKSTSETSNLFAQIGEHPTASERRHGNEDEIIKSTENCDEDISMREVEDDGSDDESHKTYITKHGTQTNASNDDKENRTVLEHNIANVITVQKELNGKPLEDKELKGKPLEDKELRGNPLEEKGETVLGKFMSTKDGSKENTSAINVDTADGRDTEPNNTKMIRLYFDDNTLHDNSSISLWIEKCCTYNYWGDKHEYPSSYSGARISNTYNYGAISSMGNAYNDGAIKFDTFVSHPSLILVYPRRTQHLCSSLFFVLDKWGVTEFTQRSAPLVILNHEISLYRGHRSLWYRTDLRISRIIILKYGFTYDVHNRHYKSDCIELERLQTANSIGLQR